MAKSIIQPNIRTKQDRECVLCKLEAARNNHYGELAHDGLHKHHIMGGPDRKKSEHWGVWCYLCLEHHETGENAVHNTGDKNGRFLKELGQRAFEKRYGHDKWMEVFGKNYL